jgi:peptidoglycan/LPS O-acetylase OafA/YrhL
MDGDLVVSVPSEKAPVSAKNTRGVVHRADIDGLRAVAVLAVIVFHLDGNVLPGGYVGVDVFFVISGFLISGIIIRRGDAFSYADFYARRVKRIFPVLAVLVVCVAMYVTFAFEVSDAKRVLWTGAAAIASVANFYLEFGVQTGYFDVSSRLNPLLHLWSLAVEEQFYFFWPTLLIHLRRSSWSRWILVCSIVVSFVLSEILVRIAPSAAYYMLPSRMGGMLIGALIAMENGGSVISDVFVGKWSQELASFAGITMISTSMVLLSDDSPFPGLNSLWPILGAALIVASSQASFCNQRLAWGPLVAVGKISYSLYLWHWPVIAVARYQGAEVGRNGIGWIVFVHAVIFAVVSFFLIERPLRAFRWNNTHVIMGLFVLPAFLCLIICGGGLVLVHSRLPPPPPSVSQVHNSTVRSEMIFSRFKLGWANWGASSSISEGCSAASLYKVGRSEGESKMLLWGDSHAMHYVGVLEEFAISLNTTFSNVCCPSCFAGDFDRITNIDQKKNTMWRI